MARKGWENNARTYTLKDPVLLDKNDYPLNVYYLHTSLSISSMNTLVKLLEKYPEKPWDWYYLSMNPNVTMEFVDRHPHLPWDWHGLSGNPNITFEFTNLHPDKPWNWHGLSGNPNVTTEFVESHPEKPWYWRGLSFNKFKYDEDLLKILLRGSKNFREGNTFKIKNSHKIYLSTKDLSQCFWKWYCGEPDGRGSGVGRMIDIRRGEEEIRR